MVDSRHVFDANRTFWSLAWIILSLVAIAYLTITETSAGLTYFVIMVTAVIAYIIGLLYINEDDSDDYEYPFDEGLLQAVTWTLLGIAVIAAFNLLSSTPSYSIIKPFAVF